MTAHKFALDQQVRFKIDRWRRKDELGCYKIIRLLPSEGHDNLYRVQSPVDSHERIVRETELVPLAAQT